MPEASSAGLDRQVGVRMLLFCALVLAATGCFGRKDPPVDADGPLIYEFQNCRNCHGENGEGVSAPTLNSQEFLQAASDEQTSLLISVGVPGTAMSAFGQDFAGPLTSEQVEAVTAFIRQWEDDAPEVPNWRDPDTQGASG